MKTVRLSALFLVLLVFAGTWSCTKTPDPAPVAKNSDNTVATFAFNGLNPAVNATISGNNITATVPVGTNLTNLVPTISIPATATISPASGTAQNFSGPVTYTVKAQDGSTQAYTVTVSIQGVSIVSFAPTTGGAGTLVVINGVGFSGVSTENKVTINGANANITASSPTQITVQIPDRAGAGNLVVAVGAKQATSASAFNYQYQLGSNTTVFTTSLGRLFQSIATDPDDGTIYASDRANSAVVIIRPNGASQSISLRDELNVIHASMTGISIIKTGVSGIDNKMMVVTNEAKGVYYYSLGAFSTTTSILRGDVFQATTDVYKNPTAIVGVSQSPTVIRPLNGTYYMACFGNSSIVRSTRLNGVTQSPSIVGSGAGFNAGSVPTTNAKFNGVVGIFLKNNLLYVADEGNHAIRVVDYNAGTVNTLIGNGTAGNVDGAVGAVRLNLPSNVVVDNAGLVYVTDRGNGKLRVYDPRSQTSQTLLSGLNAPYGLTIDNNGTLYLGEWGQGTNRILKLTVK